jgi:hypothetical protein
MAIIQLNTLVTYWQNISDWIVGTSSSKPKILKDGRQQQILTTTPLGIDAIYTSPVFDTLSFPQINNVSAHVYTDQEGVLYMDISMDNSDWDYVQKLIPVSANITAIMDFEIPLDRYFRFRFVNNSIAQTTFRLSTVFMN